MRESLAVGKLGLGLGRPLRVLDHRDRTGARGEEGLVGVGHATAQADRADQRGDDHQTATSATRLVLFLRHGLVELGVGLAVALRGAELGWILRGLELAGVRLGISLARCRHVVAEIVAAWIGLLPPGRSSGPMLALLRIAVIGILVRHGLRWIAIEGHLLPRTLGRERQRLCIALRGIRLREMESLHRLLPVALLRRPLWRRLRYGLRIGLHPEEIIRRGSTRLWLHPQLPVRTAPRHGRNPLSIPRSRASNRDFIASRQERVRQ